MYVCAIFDCECTLAVLYLIHTANVIPIKSAGNPCVPKCSCNMHVIIMGIACIPVIPIISHFRYACRNCIGKKYVYRGSPLSTNSLKEDPSYELSIQKLRVYIVLLCFLFKAKEWSLVFIYQILDSTDFSKNQLKT